MIRSFRGWTVLALALLVLAVAVPLFAQAGKPAAAPAAAARPWRRPRRPSS